VGRSRYKIKENQAPHFLTCTVVGWQPVFTRPETVQYIIDSFTYLKTNDQFILYGYVILENHLHFIAGSEDLGRDIARFKSYTARRIIDYLQKHTVSIILSQLAANKAAHKTDRTYQLWQEGAHPQQIQNDAMMREKLEYIHYNPVKRGYVDKPEDWRYSSARNYAGQTGLIDICRVW